MSRRNTCIEDANLSPTERAVRREVRMLRGFYLHLTVFLMVNGGLAAFQWLAHPERPHLHFVTLGWGIALAIHGLRVLVRGRWLGHEWEEAKVRSLLQQRAAQQ